MKILKNKVAKIIIAVAAILFMLPVIAFGILYIFIIPPQKLTPIVVNLVNENLNARFECNKVELTLLSSYPHFGIRIDSGYLLSNVAHDTVSDIYEYQGTDTLLTFSKCEALFKAFDYLRKGEITIGNLAIEDAHIYGFVNTKGKANWDIAKDTTTSTDSLSTPLPPINLNHLQIKNANLAYYNRVQQLFTAINGLSLEVKGDFVKDTNFLDITADWKKFRFYSKTYSLQNTLDLQLSTKLEISNNYHRFKFPNTKLTINEIPFSIQGELFNNSETNRLDTDIAYELTVPDMKGLLMFIPKKYTEGHNLKTKGEIHMAGTLKGALGETDYPVVKSTFSIKDGAIHSDKIKYGIDEIELDMDISLDMANNNDSYFNLKKAFIKSENINLDIAAKTTNLLTNPLFNGTIKSNINFTELSKSFLTSDTIKMNGKLFVDVQTHFSLNDILKGDYGRMQSTGEIDVSDFELLSDPYKIDMLVTKAKVTMTSERTIDKVADGKRLLNAKVYIDSVNMVYGNNINTNIKNLYASLSTPAVPDTNSIVPVTGHISFNRIRAQLPDSVWVRMGKTEIKGGIFPSSTNKKSPVLIATMDSDSLVYLMQEVKTGILLTKSAFNMRIVQHTPPTRNRLKVARDSTLKPRRNIEHDSTLILKGTSSQFFAKHDITGKVGFNKIRLWTPYFPIRIEMTGTDVKFTNNDLHLSDTQLTLGKSDFLLNGKISNIRQALLRGGKLSAELSTSSNYINYEELIDAIGRGATYSQQTHKNDTVSIKSLNDLQELSKTVTNNDSVAGLFVLPAYLNLNLVTKAKKLDYKHITLLNTQGQLVLRNQTAQLTNFYLQSNIGEGGMSMFYTARNKKEATLGLDVDMKGILVEKFISLAPSMDTLLPMLKSFEGILDCQMVATCVLDSTSSVMLPSLEAACYLRGKNLVLLDGETFTEISKKLMFKNKKRNMIDSIAVDVTVNKDNIEIYPFLIEMDRYRLAVGGTHNLDMSFNYHISVLKSPVPFKLGIDITGTTDLFKYKITKCRYKDMFKSAKTGTIDTTRLNVRREIYNAIQNKIKSNLNNNYRERRFSETIENSLASDSLQHTSLAQQPAIKKEDEIE